jgi:hypothetical protein
MPRFIVLFSSQAQLPPLAIKLATLAIFKKKKTLATLVNRHEKTSLLRDDYYWALPSEMASL